MDTAFLVLEHCLAAPSPKSIPITCSQTHVLVMIVNYIVDSQGTTLLVLNFAILVRQYFAGFHCQDLNKKI